MTRATKIDDAPDADTIGWRSAIRLSIASIVWTVGSSSVSIGAGLATESLLLVVFGAVGLMDLIGSAVLVTQFRHARRHQAVSAVRERRTVVVIAAGLTAIALVTIAVSTDHLIEHSSTEFSLVGSIVAGSSIVALAMLAVGKQRTAARIASRALLADSHLSAVGALFATFTLVGTLAMEQFGWWWLDPAASLVIALGALTLAFGHAQSRPGGD